MVSVRYWNFLLLAIIHRWMYPFLFAVKKTVLTLFILGLCNSCLWAQSAQLVQEINKIIQYDSDVSYDLTPGFVVGILDGDSSYLLSFGKVAGTKNEPLPVNAVFETGSVSKALTSLLIFTLEAKGILKLSDKVNGFLPTEFQNPRLQNLTLIDLLNHTAHFPRRPSGFGEFEEDPQNPYQFYSKQNLLKYYSRYVPVKGVSDFSYSHINYALLEIVIESATGLTYGDALDGFVLQPLGMANSFVDYREQKKDVVTAGIDRSLTAAEPWIFESFSASEGFKTTAADLLSFAKPFLGLSGSQMDFYAPGILGSEHPSYNEKLFYSSGWHGIKINKKTKALINNGNTSGHSAFIGMVPENRTAVVVLSNSAFGTKDLGLLILRMINYNWKRKPQ
jgi:CubicO group peptidase (beta-lactamase class C family)